VVLGLGQRVRNLENALDLVRNVSLTRIKPASFSDSNEAGNSYDDWVCHSGHSFVTRDRSGDDDNGSSCSSFEEVEDDEESGDDHDEIDFCEDKENVKSLKKSPKSSMSSKRELFGTSRAQAPALQHRVLMAPEAEEEAREDAKQALLDELVSMAAALKGEATSISRHLQDQNKDLEKLSDIAEITSSKLGGEVTRLHAHFRRQLVSICGGIFHMIVILVVFFIVAVFMRVFPRRFHLIDVARSALD
jgi:hypothetical protein